MAKIFHICVVLVITIVTLLRVNCKFSRVCYLRVDNSSLDTNSISKICSHIIIGFASVINGTITPTNPNDIIFYENVLKLKQNNSIKIMLSIGGGGNEQGFHEVCSNQTNIQIFIDSVLLTLIEYGFDGLDIDWEYPSWNTQYPDDKQKFVFLLKFGNSLPSNAQPWDANQFLRERKNFTFDSKVYKVICDIVKCPFYLSKQLCIQKHETEYDELSEQFIGKNNESKSGHELLLSVAVSAIVNIVDDAYIIPELAKYVDFINLMTYDFHRYTKYWPFTGFNAPLYGRANEKSYFTYLNTNWSANYWNFSGISKNKIMIGIPTYGVSFRLADKACNGPDCAAFGADNDFTFPQICQLLSNSSTHRVFNNESKVPYLYNDNLWISYDDIESVTYKAQWIKQNNFSGAMTFDLNADDYQNECFNGTNFVLQSVINSILNE